MKEEELIELIRKGEKDLYEVIMRKYNQRLYRIARSIVKEDSEIDDILQDTYLKAYEALSQFRKESLFSTWIIRILINTANASLKKRKRFEQSPSLEKYESASEDQSQTPESYTSNSELKKILEEAIDHLPDNLRCVYIMREVEGLNVAETASCLDISEENVKTRLHRAKAFLKEELYQRTKGDIDIFRFGSWRCDRVVASVLFNIHHRN